MALARPRIPVRMRVHLIGAPALITVSVPPVSAQIAPTAAIQSLIDAATTGGTVSLPAGVLHESLTASKNITLTGVSSATTEIHARLRPEVEFPLTM